jgi:hypothetical protein
MPVRQVYAWIVDEGGRVLLIDMPGGWNLPGGTPEECDHVDSSDSKCPSRG